MKLALDGIDCHATNHAFVDLRTNGCHQPGYQCNIMLLQSSKHKIKNVLTCLKKQKNVKSCKENQLNATLNQILKLLT